MISIDRMTDENFSVTPLASRSVPEQCHIQRCRTDAGKRSRKQQRSPEACCTLLPQRGRNIVCWVGYR